MPSVSRVETINKAISSRQNKIASSTFSRLPESEMSDFIDKLPDMVASAGVRLINLGYKARENFDEELYITMNNRGESLTEAEQIKPLLFEKVESSEKHKFGKLWDEIEEYFYALKPVEKGIEIVDTMMNRFIQLILQLENQTEKSIGGSTRFTPEEIQKIDFQKIEIYYKALKLIESNFKEKEK